MVKTVAFSLHSMKSLMRDFCSCESQCRPVQFCGQGMTAIDSDRFFHSQRGMRFALWWAKSAEPNQVTLKQNIMARAPSGCYSMADSSSWNISLGEQDVFSQNQTQRCSSMLKIQMSIYNPGSKFCAIYTSNERVCGHRALQVPGWSWWCLLTPSTRELCDVHQVLYLDERVFS